MEFRKDTGRVLYFLLTSLCFVTPLSSRAECTVISRNGAGKEFVQCDQWSEPLPLCGSEYDTGTRCVVRRGRTNRSDGTDGFIPIQPSARGQIPFNAAGNTPFDAAGKTPMNAGASWPNQAAALGQQK